MKKYLYIILSLVGIAFIFAIYKSETSRLKGLSKYNSLKEEDWKGKKYYPPSDGTIEPFFDKREKEKVEEYSNDIQDKLVAYNWAIEFVNEKLVSPSSAKYPTSEEKVKAVTYSGNNEYYIVSWVDSQNSYGVMIRSRFVCRLQFNDDEVSLIEFYLE